LSNILRAKKRDLEIIDAASLEQPKSHQDVVRLEYPHKSRSGWVIEGTEQEKAEKLLQILNKKSLLR
jgi:electron transfer flavoprotein alpha/beta subunit